MTVLKSLDDVPEFENEAQEADFWATHELGEDILEGMRPVEFGASPLPRHDQRPTDPR